MSDSGFTGQSSSGIWHSLNRFVFTLIVLTASVPIAYSFLPELKIRKDHDAMIEQLKADIEQERMKQQRYEREEKLLRLDPEFISIIARDRLDLMKEGDTIFRVDSPKPARSQMKLNP
ncbi:MAG TPA: septum formation initiator family protein [Chthoniobacteraceae bacterium]|nr:septum formation initiator family protein [Chthoniobacteraceae bacterium]